MLEPSLAVGCIELSSLEHPSARRGPRNSLHWPFMLPALRESTHAHAFFSVHMTLHESLNMAYIGKTHTESHLLEILPVDV